MAFKRSAAILLLLALLLSASGCSARSGSEKRADAQTKTAQTPPTPEPAVRAEPAELLTGVETDRKVVSLIFEGYTDSSTMEAIADVLKERDVPSTFFVSGITANENPDVVRGLAADFDIGNYGMSGGKHLELLSAYENMRRFEMAQREILAACGRTPELIRCNGTEYTDDVLRAVTAAGLSAAVEPTAYLNHKSFKSEEDAQAYVLNVLRGSILTVKLGQELDENEYGDPGRELDERPAIDPSPGVRWEWSAEDERFALLPDIVAWLVDALQASGYSFTDPISLQSEMRTILPKLREMDEDERRELNADNYVLPLTAKPVSAGEQKKAQPGDFDGAVFVGDAVMEGIASYVEWQREADPDYLDGAEFLTENQLTIEKLVDGESEIGDLAVKLREMGAKSVWLCVAFGNQSAYRREAFLSKYRLLVKEIQEKNPDIRIVFLSIPPKLDNHAGVSNQSRFALSLKLCGMCREYGLAFCDAASALRDEKGLLREDYCLDAAGRGSHLNDAGCAAFVDYIRENKPV